MNTIHTLTDQAVDAAIQLGLIKAPATFKRRLVARKGRAWYRCTGGMDWRAKRPQLTYGHRWWHWKEGVNLGAFPEYARIAQDPVIGSHPRHEDTCRIPLVLVCHELAHAICHWNWHRQKRRDRLGNPHGPQWRWTYRQLRRHFDLVRPD